jgi:hypothetical protein
MKKYTLDIFLARNIMRDPLMLHNQTANRLSQRTRMLHVIMDNPQQKILPENPQRERC